MERSPYEVLKLLQAKNKRQLEYAQQVLSLAEELASLACDADRAVERRLRRSSERLVSIGERLLRDAEETQALIRESS